MISNPLGRLAVCVSRKFPRTPFKNVWGISYRFILSGLEFYIEFYTRFPLEIYSKTYVDFCCTHIRDMVVCIL